MLKGRYQLLKGYQNNHVTIGFGSYGQVKLAKDLQTGDIVAVKIINKVAKNQIIFHDKLSHPKIIQLLNHFIDKERQITYMVLEYADDGTLFQKIKTNPLTKKQIKSYFKDICQAVLYLHSKEIMHRDIKPQNILLTKIGQAKLCDFGFAAILGQRKTLCGTYEYMSPEMIQNKSYDYKIDIWALGILLFQMISGQAPFRGESPDQVLRQMKTKIYFCDRFQSEQINLIKMILRVTPYKRPTVIQILQHSFFRDQNEKQQTIVHQMKKLSSIASNSNLEKCVSNNEGKFFISQFMKKQKLQNFNKQPQNSYPFYVPKNKYQTKGSTELNDTATNINNKIIMPQNNYQNKFQINQKIDYLSPKKTILTPTSSFTTQTSNLKLNKNLPSKLINTNMNNEPCNSSSTTNTQSSKNLNYSMGYSFKTKFTSMHGEHIQNMNNNNEQNESNQFKFNSPKSKHHKALIYPQSGVVRGNLNRFS